MPALPDFPVSDATEAVQRKVRGHHRVLGGLPLPADVCGVFCVQALGGRRRAAPHRFPAPAPPR